MPDLAEKDRSDLATAVKLLENPGLPVRIANHLGMPIQKLMSGAPYPVLTATETAIRKGLDAALWSMAPGGANRAGKRSALAHKLAATASGATGGALGLTTLAVELPISTIIMLRAIADIARREGEDLNDPDAKIACIQVFALGGPTGSDDNAETGYFAVRAALAKAVTAAAEHLAGRQTVEVGSSVMVRVVTFVAERFAIPVSAKAVAQALPALGAAGGAAINWMFIDHFQDMARGHFIVRRLERQYGKETVEHWYNVINKTAGR